MCMSLHWRHNDHGGVSNHQPRGCLLNRSFRRRWKKTSTLRVTGICGGNSPGPVNSPHKGLVTRKMFPFDDVIMVTVWFNSKIHGNSRPIRSSRIVFGNTKQTFKYKDMHTYVIIMWQCSQSHAIWQEWWMTQILFTEKLYSDIQCQNIVFL